MTPSPAPVLLDVGGYEGDGKATGTVGEDDPNERRLEQHHVTRKALLPLLSRKKVLAYPLDRDTVAEKARDDCGPEAIRRIPDRHFGKNVRL